MTTPTCCFVTGANGFVGRHLCRALRALGHRVVALVRGGEREVGPTGIEFVPGDLTAPGPWSAAVADAHLVFHCAAQAGFGAGPAANAVNVAGTRALLDAARHAPHLRRVIFVSTIGAVDRAPGDDCAAPLDAASPLRPTSAYGRSKRDAEILVRSSALPFAIVRPGMVVGADMRAESHFAVFMRAALRGDLFARIGWTGTFGVVHVDDLVAALLRVAEHPDAAGQTYFCTGSPCALRDAFAWAQPQAARLPVGWLAALARLIPAAVPFRAKALLLPALVADDGPLRRLGWQPQHAPAAALAGTIARERARLDPAADPGGQTVITGAASGLGAALVEKLAPQRRRLLLVDRERGGLERLALKFPHCAIHVADLADSAAVDALVRSDVWQAAPVRELYLCAGFGLRGPMLAFAAADHARLFQVNVLARLALAHAALPDMLRAGFGRVVWVSSSSAFQPLPYMASYAAANAALLSLGEAWGAELRGRGVHFLQVCPGGMRTNFQQAAGVKVNAGEKLMPPAEAADLIGRALVRGQATAIISPRARAMGLLARLLPRAWSVALWEKLMRQLR